MKKHFLMAASILVTLTGIVAAEPSTTLPANTVSDPSFDNVMPECNFDHIALEDVVAFYRDATGLSLVIDERAFQEAKLSEKVLVTLHAKKMTQREVLAAITKAISKPGHEIVADRVGRIVFITSAARLKGSIQQYQDDLAKAGKDDPASLKRLIPDVNFNKVALSDVVDFLCDVTGDKIDPDWEKLKRAGVLKETPIDLRISNVPLHEVLRAILNQAAANGNGTGTVDFTVGADGSIKIVFVAPAT